jgi:uronate dehydrogenase
MRERAFRPAFARDSGAQLSDKLKVLVTGSAGKVATMFREWAKDRYDIVCFDRRPTPGVPDAVVADLTDRAALERAMAGCDAVLALGAQPNPADFLSVIVPCNIIGAYNLFEAAVRTKVKRVVYASTVQTEFGHEEGVKVSTDMAPKPANVYAASKVWAENLAHIYSRRHGLSTICLRLGAVLTPVDLARWIAGGWGPDDISLTQLDACNIFSRALEVAGVDYAVVPAYSLNAKDIKDFAPLKRVLGYEPRQDARDLWPKEKPKPTLRRRLRRLYYRSRWRVRRRWWRLKSRLRRLARWRPRLPHKKPRILITGSAGLLGTAVRRRLADRYDFICFDRRTTPGVPNAFVAELSDTNTLARACRKADFVLHLAAARDEADFTSVILPDNIIGTWNLYQAAADTGVKRVVFASSCQAEDGWPKGTRVSVEMPALPLNFYAASKVLGESLGRTFAFWRWGGTTISVIALRFGWIRIPEDPEWVAHGDKPAPAIALDLDDACDIIVRALEVKDVRFALLPAYSRGAEAVKDLEPLRKTLGWGQG